MDTTEKQHASQSQTLLLLPRLRLPPSGLMASPQLGPSSISSWVKSVVAPSGLTRHEAGDGSCNREIRVVLGCLALLYRRLSMTCDICHLDAGVKSHFIMHRFTITQYVRSTRAYNISSILLVFERTISCKLIVRSHLWSYPCLLYTSPSPRDRQKSRMPSSA